MTLLNKSDIEFNKYINKKRYIKRYKSSLILNEKIFY